MSDICMLAHKFNDHSKKISYPVIIQPKIDGVRMTWQKHLDVPITRNGKRIFNIEHIVNALRIIGQDNLDGEIYHPAMTFEQINGLVRRSRNTCQTDLQYWIFDLIEPLPCRDRLRRLDEILPATASPTIVSVPWSWAHDITEVYASFSRYTREGFEGIMIRNPESFYQAKRTKDLLKLKLSKSSKAKIIGWIPGKGKHEGRMGTLVVQSTEPGESWSCEVGTGFSDKEREWDYVKAHLFCGKEIVVTFQEFTSQNIPRFPVYGGFHAKA